MKSLIPPSLLNLIIPPLSQFLKASWSIAEKMIQKSNRANDTALLGSFCHWKCFRCSPKIRYTWRHTIMKSPGGQPPFSKSFQSSLRLTESKALEPFVFKLRKLSLVARSQCQRVTYRRDLQGNNSPSWIRRGNSEVCFSLSCSWPSTFSLLYSILILSCSSGRVWKGQQSSLNG